MDETFATGFVNPKSTALFFDKLYIPEKIVKSRTSFGTRFDYTSIPQEVRYDYHGELDEWYGSIFDTCCRMNSCRFRPEGIFFPNRAYNSANLITLQDIERSNLRGDVKQRLIDSYNGCNDFYFSIFRNEFLQFIAQEFQENFKIKLVPIFFDKTDFEIALEKEKSDRILRVAEVDKSKYIESNVYEAIISCDKMIDENQLSWEQVLDIRKDEIARAKLKRFRNWANTGFKNCTKDQAIDKIGEIYNDYEKAINKHGIKTILGSLGTVLSQAAIGILSNWGGDTVNFIGLGLQIAVGAIPLGKTIKEYVKLRQEPIAYFYDIFKKIKRN